MVAVVGLSRRGRNGSWGNGQSGHSMSIEFQ